MMEIKDNLIVKPKCGCTGCNNDALVYVSGKFVCGECANKLYTKMNKIVLEMMEDKS